MVLAEIVSTTLICVVCGYDRKHAIELMSAKANRKKKRRGRKPQYGKPELLK